MPLKGWIAWTVLLCAPTALACTCRNDFPIQPTLPRYAGRAVFTARVLHLLGPLDQSHRSSLALAIVRERHWGLPWFWPAIVLLDGRYPCDIAMAAGDDLLVAGTRISFGAVLVNGCSGTRSLSTAAVDLRTLDGARCSGSGGSLLGIAFDKDRPASGVALRFTDANGREYHARSDAQGVYELLHVPPGRYTLDPMQGPGRWAYGIATVSAGVCSSLNVGLAPYTMAGRVTPASVADNARIRLIPVNDEAREYEAQHAVGGTFFVDAPPGEYHLVADFDMVAHPHRITRVYYPGTADRKHAARVQVGATPSAGWYEFAADAIPVAPIPLAVDTRSGADGIPAEVVVRHLGRVVRTFSVSTGSVVSVPVEIGGIYEISARTDQSAAAHCQVVVRRGMAPVRLRIPD